VVEELTHVDQKEEEKDQENSDNDQSDQEQDEINFHLVPYQIPPD
jgi:hypothetical protein